MPLQRSRIVQTHAPTLGRRSDVFIARLPNGVRAKPADQTLTVATGGAAKGNTTITLSAAINTTIAAGQYLCFANSDGAEFIAQVTALVQSGTSLPVAPLPEAIPAGAVAEFPTYLWDRTAADLERSYNRATFATFNTGGDEDAVVTGASRTLSLPGLYYFKNAAYLTALKAANDGAELWVRRELPPPSPAYQLGAVIEGPASVTAAPTASPVDGNVSADLTLAFNGSPTETDPVPTA